ncbi:chromosome segregation protein SMC [Pseudoalteromonas sp. MEBiC 03607]|uniref:chromosome segregation SMC family protein n=1 Tax=Pseudoalteromonas sp. MEBiC 03607 TaxID=2563601 RepID=UPI0010938806|nr:AAA family ATPase [Pseudoalteromonas sp. MEBiC 03607]TGV20970.1 chromosome segregation protein SMC [Pseudoalteromonas sp. MEBiC 03607]
MRLSTIKLAGFKSFVEPTKIPFPDQMTCVVGPNGCGKSNVIDAVRWVLGESSAKNLRGDAMTDVIFNGSTNRKPISQASVELVFDNTSGHLPNTFADRNQVAIKRLVTRDGQSIYFLNGSKCRKRDITDIFLGTGLGPRSYAIIEQGMISRLIESKPADLRVFLEEAAGVSKYKERRRETQTRIKSTRENLERLLDVRQELQTQLDKLAVQSVEAKKYRELKATERTLKGQIAVLKWQKLHQQQIDKAEQINKLKEQIQFFKEAHSGHDDVLASLENQVQLEQQKLQDAQQAQHQTHTELTRKEQQQISLKQQQQTLSQNLIKQQQLQLQNKELQEEQHASAVMLQELLQEAIEQSLLCAEQVAEVEQQVAEQHQYKQSADEQYQSTLQKNQTHASDITVAKSQQAHFAQTVAQLESQQAQLDAEISELEATPVAAQIAEQQQHIQTLTKELAQQQSALNKLTQNLEQADKEQQHLEQDFRRVQQHSNENKASIAALNSLLSEQTDSESVSLLVQLKVASGFEPLIEQALLGLEHLKVSQHKEANSVWPANECAAVPKESLANYIESGAYPDLLARFAFQPCFDDAILADPYWLAVIDEEGCIHGRNFHTDANKDADNSLLLKHAQLSDAQQLDEELNEQLETKQQLLNEHLAHKKTLIVDKEQHRERIHQAAQQIASASTRRDMLLEQQTQWQNQLVKLQQRETLLAEQKQNADEQQQAQQSLLEQLLEQQLTLETELEQAKQRQTEANNNYRQVASQLEQYKTQAHQANLAEQKARSECQLSETKLQHANAAQSAASEAVLELNEQLEELVIPLEEVAEQIMLLLEKHQQSDVELKNLQAALSQAKKELADKQTALKSSQSELVTLQEQLQALALDEQSLIVKAQAALEPLEELEQNLKTVLEELPDSANLNSMQAMLTKTTQALNELGAVNLAAIDEFEQAKQRSDYLNQQLDDLTQALNTLEGAIQKIDRETKNRFKATFEQVNTDFGELFPKVFGGGSAYLELTSDDLLESGVSIMARPPGKKNSTIHLLSGGEKALTALSLVFSIFRLNPAPFCMLDEVDAPLDDANVGRFCRLVEEMSQSVQFIYISHNKIAMEMAGRLTGVTMAEPGVSRMVAVDIEQAVQMAHA